MVRRRTSGADLPKIKHSIVKSIEASILVTSQENLPADLKSACYTVLLRTKSRLPRRHQVQKYPYEV